VNSKLGGQESYPAILEKKTSGSFLEMRVVGHDMDVLWKRF